MERAAAAGRCWKPKRPMRAETHGARGGWSRAGPGSGCGEGDIDRLGVDAALVVLPRHRQRRLPVRPEREADDRVPADPRGPLEAGDLVATVRDDYVVDEIGGDGVAFLGAEEPRVHGMGDDRVDRDDL